jgi:hypothetical protein
LNGELKLGAISQGMASRTTQSLTIHSICGCMDFVSRM